MQSLRKAAAVVVAVGGLGLVGSGIASAAGGHSYDDPFPYDAPIENLQAVECEQSFEVGSGIPTEPPVPGVAGGDNETNVGNFCTVIGSVGD